jgi:hypothetical protein
MGKQKQKSEGYEQRLGLNAKNERHFFLLKSR